LFEGLYIKDKYDWSKKYPVIKLMLNDEFSMLNVNEIENIIINKLLNIAKEHDVIIEKSLVSIMFSELLRNIYNKYNKSVVILIDDWDKPLRDNLMTKNAKEINRLLWGIYINTKSDDAYIKFAFATGEIPICSSMLEGFNNFTDISLHKRYGNICGYTQEDIQTSILPYLDGVDLEKLKVWYNGYNFLKDDVYNPFDILLFIKNDFIFDNYWFETGTPTFLMQLISKYNYFLPSLTNIKVDKKLLNSFDIENLDLEVILYQAGYLTIDRVEIDEDIGTIEYFLKIPNKEVKLSLSQYIVSGFFNDKLPAKKDLYHTLKNKQLEHFKDALTSIFASIPYNNFTKNDMQTHEGFYASVVYVYLQSLGLDIVGEDVTNKGRIDLTIKMDQAIYILEFKVDGTSALQQIKDKNYAQKYLNDKRDIYLLGIEFDSNEKNINNFEWEKVIK
jgi:hypothetical protein